MLPPAYFLASSSKTFYTKPIWLDGHVAQWYSTSSELDIQISKFLHKYFFKSSHNNSKLQTELKNVKIKQIIPRTKQNKTKNQSCLTMRRVYPNFKFILQVWCFISILECGNLPQSRYLLPYVPQPLEHQTHRHSPQHQETLYSILYCLNI